MPVGQDTSTKVHDVQKIHVRSLWRLSEADGSDGTAYGPMAALSLAYQLTVSAPHQSRSPVEPARITRVRARTGSTLRGCALCFGLANPQRGGVAQDSP